MTTNSLVPDSCKKGAMDVEPESEFVILSNQVRRYIDVLAKEFVIPVTDFPTLENVLEEYYDHLMALSACIRRGPGELGLEVSAEIRSTLLSMIAHAESHLLKHTEISIERTQLLMILSGLESNLGKFVSSRSEFYISKSYEESRRQYESSSSIVHTTFMQSAIKRSFFEFQNGNRERAIEIAREAVETDESDTEEVKRSLIQNLESWNNPGQDLAVIKRR